jgi:hypothetical protein
MDYQKDTENIPTRSDTIQHFDLDLVKMPD